MSMNRNQSMNRSSNKILVFEMNLLTLWPWPLNPKTVPLLGYTKVILYTKFEHNGDSRQRVFSDAPDKQTDRLKNPKIVDVGNSLFHLQLDWTQVDKNTVKMQIIRIITWNNGYLLPCLAKRP